MVQCLSLLHGFAKQCLDSGSAHCQWVLIYDNHLKRLICLGYWRTKHWTFLVWADEAKANKFCRMKVCEADEVKEYFINPETENEALG